MSKQVLVAALFGVAVLARAQPAALVPDSTVVVLVGLPGDVESESAYARQLGALLEALAEPAAAPRRVIVLSDAPASVRFPRAFSGESRANSRDSLLALARERQAAAGPLVVIAWGHGGQIGTEPVLHVRGPRIRPQDLAQLAGSGPSRSVLYFRGSGAFARALSRPDRQVLASEGSTAFRSDPIGVDLLVQALRATPGATLEQLAARVGRETVRWYEGQRLARQEEPTLFAAGTTRAMAEAGPPAATRETPTAAAAPTAAWEGITPVDPARFKDAAAVMLRHVQRTTIGSQPAVTQDVDSFVQILTEEGESHGDVDVTFSPPDERVVFLDVEVRHADGRVTRLDPAAIPDGGVREVAPGYVAPARRVFSLPGVEPGAIVRVHHRSEWARFPLPHVFLEAPLSHPVPVLDATVEVSVGSGTPLHYGSRGRDVPPPEIQETAYGRTYTWRLGASDATLDEALGPPDAQPRLQLSTFPDWAAFAGWYARLVQMADEATPEIVATAAAVVAGRTTARDKVAALYDFVTSMRYVAVPLGVNSHRPHAAANVLRNRYGDCKDKANLFNTLLATQGIKAHLVLVPRFGDVDERTPGLGFNHAISRVLVDGDWIWADTTDEFARFGLLPPGDSGRNVLVVDGGSALTRLPAADAKAHRLTLRARVPAVEGERGTIEVEAHGFADYALRQTARAVAGAGATRPVLAEGLRPTAGAFALVAQSHAPVSDLKRTFTWRGEGRFSGHVSPGADGQVLVSAPFWLPREWELALHQRRSPLFLNAGYPLLLDQQLEIGLPNGYAAAHVPADASNESGPLRYAVRWRPLPTGLRAQLQLELEAGEMDALQSTAFQQQIQALMRAVSAPATARPGDR